MFGVGALGACIALWLHFPAPYLTGSILGVSILTLTGFGAPMPNLLRNAIFVLIGINLGASVRDDSSQVSGETSAKNKAT